MILVILLFVIEAGNFSWARFGKRNMAIAV